MAEKRALWTVYLRREEPLKPYSIGTWISPVQAYRDAARRNVESDTDLFYVEDPPEHERDSERARKESDAWLLAMTSPLTSAELMSIRLHVQRGH